MELFEAILSRRSSYKFKKKTISYNILFDILTAGYSAPAVGNIHSTSIIIVESDKLKAKITESSDKQSWMLSAPVFLVVCSDSSNLKKLYSDRGIKLFSIQNSAAIIENMLLAARKFGLQGTWIGAFSEDKIKSILSIPKKIDVHAIVALGYPDDFPETKSEIPALHRTFYEKWSAEVKAEKILPLAESRLIKETRAKLNKKSENFKKRLTKKLGKTINYFK